MGKAFLIHPLKGGRAIFMKEKTKTARRSKKGKRHTVNKGAGDGSSPAEGDSEAKAQKKFTQGIFRDWCKSCGICSAFCPKKVIGRDENGAPVVEHPDDCIGCRFCELHCPDFAITIKQRDAGAGRHGP
jgi:2-oxoglutarate ferredoxin oxidoreductase subunit delta